MGGQIASMLLSSINSSPISLISYFIEGSNVTEILNQNSIHIPFVLTYHVYCKICGDHMEYSDEERELGGDFKICLNCRLLGPDVPAEYVIPRGSDLDKSIHDRQFPIVSDKEISGIWQEYTDQMIEYARKAREKYGQK